MVFRHVEHPAEIQACMRPGDVIAFSGGKFVSDVIMAITKGNVSHVGIIVPSEFLGKPCDEPVVAEVNQNGLIFSPLSDIVEDDNDILWWLPLANRPTEACLSTAVEEHRKTKYDWLQAGLLALEYFESACESVGRYLRGHIRSMLLDGGVRLLRGELIRAGSRFISRETLEDNLSEESLRILLAKAIDNHLEANDIADFLVESIGNREDTTRLFCSEFVAKVLEDSKVIPCIEEAQTTPIELCLIEDLYAKCVQFKGCESQETKRHDTPDDA